jgi:hypothetical protein
VIKWEALLQSRYSPSRTLQDLEENRYIFNGSFFKVLHCDQQYTDMIITQPSVNQAQFCFTLVIKWEALLQSRYSPSRTLQDLE